MVASGIFGCPGWARDGRVVPHWACVRKGDLIQDNYCLPGVHIPQAAEAAAANEHPGLPCLDDPPVNHQSSTHCRQSLVAICQLRPSCDLHHKPSYLYQYKERRLPSSFSLLLPHWRLYLSVLSSLPRPVEQLRRPRAVQLLSDLTTPS